MSDTPRTDAVTARFKTDTSLATCYEDMAFHARQLERELNEAKAKLTWLEADITWPCSISEENQKLREQRDAALAQCAAMRESLEKAINLRRSLCFNGCEVCANESGCKDDYLRRFQAALSSDAGKDFVHKSTMAAEVEQLRRTCADLVIDGNAITLAESLHKMEVERDFLRLKVAAAEGMAKSLGDVSHALGQARQSSQREAMEKLCVALGLVNEARAAWGASK